MKKFIHDWWLTIMTAIIALIFMSFVIYDINYGTKFQTSESAIEVVKMIENRNDVTIENADGNSMYTIHAGEKVYEAHITRKDIKYIILKGENVAPNE